MKQTRYPILSRRQKVELEIKKSKFIGHACHTESKATAMAFIALIKSENPQANHNCWAFQAGPPGDSREVGCSDDGEPHGTAGRPMLNVLQHADIGEITVVATRYFGGVKLGTGGLARAYADTVKAVLDSAALTEKLDFEEFALTLNYTHWPAVELLLKKYQAEDIQTKFTDKVLVIAKIDEKLLDEFYQKFKDSTFGAGLFSIKTN